VESAPRWRGATPAPAAPFYCTAGTPRAWNPWPVNAKPAAPVSFPSAFDLRDAAEALRTLRSTSREHAIDLALSAPV